MKKNESQKKKNITKRCQKKKHNKKTTVYSYFLMAFPTFFQASADRQKELFGRYNCWSQSDWILDFN